MKNFEEFSSILKSRTLVLNPAAEEAISSSAIRESEEVFWSQDVAESLESLGYIEGRDFLRMHEALNVKSSGLQGKTFYITIGGHRYGYGEKEGGTEIKEIARKFEKILQFSAGRALNWLKKNTELVSGGKDQLEKDADKVEESSHEGITNYMFFQNLQIICDCAKEMMEMDKATVDELLKEHNWALDHIATSKDDVEEVCGWMKNQMKKQNL